MKMRPEHEKKAVKVLCETAPFSAISPVRIRFLITSDDVHLKEFSAGQQIFPCRSLSDCIGVLISGECRSMLGKKIVYVGHEGEIFGLAELYSSQSTTSLKAVAAQVCRVLFIPRDAVDMFIETNSDFARSYIALLSESVLKSQSQAQTLAGGSAEKALSEYLLSRPRNSKGEVALPQDTAKLAKQLGLGKSSLFKAIDALNSSGAISFNGNAVCIKDEEKLKSFI